MTSGKQRLIEAAARLTRREPYAMPGLRALAREAGLNHNTFYRHFKDLDALREAAAGAFAADLLARLKAIRLDTQPFPPDALVTTLFDSAELQPDTFILAYRILHGGPSSARTVMQNLTATLAVTLFTDLAALSLLPQSADPARLGRMFQAHITHVLTFATLLTETPSARLAVQAQAGELLSVLLAGIKENRLLI